jgi:hypothetical protein
MSDPKKQAIICPQCSRPEVHFNCQLGFYCRACDRELSSEETRAFVEQEIFKMETDDGL